MRLFQRLSIVRVFDKFVAQARWFWVQAAVCMLLAVVWGMTWRLIELERATEDREIRSTTQHLSSVYSALMIRALDQIDLTLGVARFACERGPASKALADLQDSVLMPSSLLFAIMVIDERGQVVASNTDDVVKDQSRAPYYRAFRDQKIIDDVLYAAENTNNGHASGMIFARRIGRPDGSFGGVVALKVDAGYLTSWYETSSLGRRGVIGLATASGHLLVTRTGDQLVWRDPKAPGAAKLLRVDRDGTELVANPWDGERRFVMSERLLRYPFATFVGLSESEQFQGFEQTRRSHLLEASVTSLVLCAFGFMLWRMSLSQARSRKAQETYQAASEASLDANVVLHTVADSAGTPQDFVVAGVNRGACDLVGKPKHELVGHRLGDFVADFRASPVFSALSEAVRTNRFSQHEWRNADARIKVDWLSAQVVPAPDGVVLIVRDISDRKRFENELLSRNAELTTLNQDLSTLNEKLTTAHEQLVQSEKLASIGLLAAGVAHEINNPIGFVLSNIGTLGGYVDKLLSLLAQYEKAEALLPDAAERSKLALCRGDAELDYLREDIPPLFKETKDGISRVRKIVEDLKSFSHVASATEWKFANLHEGIDSTINIVNNELKYVADVVRAYGDLPPVECLPSEINQVILNLLVNAGHAMGPQRGSVTVRTGVTGESAWIEVEDTGCGIAPENLARIFDPFFTTKPIGKGTGLGLSLSYGIVKKHGGDLTVRSELGRGTCFRVSLPLRRLHQGEETSSA